MLLSVTAFGRIGWHGSSFEIPGAIQMRAVSVLVSADDQVIDVKGVGVINLSSDDAVAVNRDFTLTQPPLPQLLIIYFDGGNAARLLDNAVSGGGTVKLSANWTAATDATLTLYYNGSDWLEMTRTNN